MPRNSSGVYSLPESSFVAGTVIRSAPVNSDLSDIANALTLSLATTGVSTMTGPIKAAAGSVSAPSYTFAAATGTGFALTGTDEFSAINAGALTAVFNADNSVDFAGDVTVAGTLLIAGNPATNFPSATTMLFRQTAAPTGWTKITTNVDNRALRVVSGTVSQGGLHDFSDVFSGTWFSDQFVLSIAEMPLHGHPFRLIGDAEDTSDLNGGMMVGDDQPRTNYSAYTGTPTDTAGQQIGGTGGGGGHDHNLDLEVLYLDTIVASRD